MDWLTVFFPVSGVHTWIWLPPMVAFVLSFFCSMVGISGAFLLMPFQMSVLGLAGPAASATNLVFNLFATPGGVWRYVREGRMFWPLAGIISLGTLPGIVLGFYLRVLYLPDAARFKLFVGVVLLYLSWRLLAGFVPWMARKPQQSGTPASSPDMNLRILHVGRQRVEFVFQGQEQGFSTPAMLALAFVVGIIGGTYGIGGGAIIAPFCIAVFRLPVHAVAGAALAGTFVTSVAGVAVYSFLPLPGGGYAAPDWWLGSLFGLGGLAGMYLGAAFQKQVPQQLLKASLGLLLAGLGGFYLLS
ncbi:MAG: sulfite exporter TauE/SafE family protein [Sulfuricellaceae bacterium]|nr:sulfite exporter TauE/SafE family protein [Sulfuricellaceae bacterium]